MVHLLALLVVLALLGASRADAQEFEIPIVTIAGGELSQSIELAPPDADAFRRRVNRLPRLDDAPSVTGPQYRVTSSYWPVSVVLEDEEDVLDVSVEADYHPDGGFVRFSIDDQDVWSVLNLRQRAILDRYIRLAEAGQIGEMPSSMEVLAAAATEERFGVAAGSEVLEFETGAALITALAEANTTPFVDPRQPPLETGESYWLIVTLPEGRALRYYYDGETVTEALGTERYDASAVNEMLEAVAPQDLPVIAEQEPVGSFLWWPVMVGGGLAAIGLAIWLRMKSTS